MRITVLNRMLKYVKMDDNTFNLTILNLKENKRLEEVKQRERIQAERQEETKRLKAAAELERQEETKRLKAAAELERQEETKRLKAAAELERQEETKRSKAAAELERQEETKRLKAAAFERKEEMTGTTKKKSRRTRGVKKCHCRLGSNCMICSCAINLVKCTKECGCDGRCTNVNVPV